MTLYIREAVLGSIWDTCPGPVQPVRLWPDQYLEVTLKIYCGLLREESSSEESVNAPSII
jgi:hypothetical protein